MNEELSYEAADAKFAAAIARMRMGTMKVPKITPMERQILEFCHERNMKEFIREEFEKHPIHLNEAGELIGENPFDKEHTEKKDFYDLIGSCYNTYEPATIESNESSPYSYGEYLYGGSSICIE